MLDATVIRLLIYLATLVFVVVVALWIDSIPGNGGRKGLRLLLFPLIITWLGIFVATILKVCEVPGHINIWTLVVAGGLTMLSLIKFLTLNKHGAD